MRFLIDTHLLIWAVGVSGRLPSKARDIISDPDNELSFSAASLWEIAIKSGRRRDDFQIDVGLIRRTLLTSYYDELPVTGEHAVAVADLPPLHKDPFDRLLIAQSIVEGITLSPPIGTWRAIPGRSVSCHRPP
ncbi:MAG TPA: type II toxin-antitoxin system VapC family toxin [Stellaceae bacterium]|nr:type II toxin-antitoxin system VapC family toxin [Stellaceae bacterium]